MSHSLGEEFISVGRDAPSRSDAWLFAQALLGKTTSTAYIADAELWTPRQQMEWLAQVSPKHERQFRGLLKEGSEANCMLSGGRQFADAITQESEWDSAKHPRRGSAPNAGWFAPAGVSTGGAGGVSSIRGASYSGPKRVAAQPVASVWDIGHHWVTKAVVFHDDIRPHLSDEAVEYAMGAYSGGTEPSHNYGPQGGIKHSDYSKAVKEELHKFIKQNKIKKMSAAQMEEFAGLIEKGLDAAGKPHPQIGPFNKAVKGLVRQGSTAPRKMKGILAAGRKYMKTSRFRVLAMGAVLSGVLSEAVSAQAQILDLAANSGHYRRAMEALQGGDVATAHRLLTGDANSLYAEILGRVGATAALNFRTTMDKAFETAEKREYK